MPLSAYALPPTIMEAGKFPVGTLHEASKERRSKTNTLARNKRLGWPVGSNDAEMKGRANYLKHFRTFHGN